MTTCESLKKSYVQFYLGEMTLNASNEGKFRTFDSNLDRNDGPKYVRECLP